ncbi:hypothetical protein SNE40_011034 [Patella caerulea]|uniref:Uncharacterized protein n=1 Tax=Patella caerulea TaxID=87958 RepID=A0AAN8JVJ3_PATCE
MKQIGILIDLLFPILDNSIWGYIKSNLSRHYQPLRDDVRYKERCGRVSTVVQTPVEFEKFYLYGSTLCLNALLDIFTFQPIRALVALFYILIRPSCIIHGMRERLTASQICDVVKIFVFILCCCIVRHFDLSVMYHLFRGKAIFNLLVLQSITDLVDALISGLGADIWDSLCWKLTQPPERRSAYFGVWLHLLLTIVYILSHTVVILLQITALTVALNSHDKLVFTIVLSSNLVEIKTNMYRRIDRNYLFYIACLDIKERFHHSLLLFIVSMKIMTDVGWNPDYLLVIVPDALWILCFEIVADWVKLAFVAKFNKISFHEYHQYRLTLATDMKSCREKLAATDYTDVVSRRIGLNVLPMGCVLVLGFCESFNISGIVGLGFLTLIFLGLFVMHIVSGTLLRRYENWLLSNTKADDIIEIYPDTDSQMIPPLEKLRPQINKDE